MLEQHDERRLHVAAACRVGRTRLGDFGNAGAAFQQLPQRPAAFHANPGTPLRQRRGITREMYGIAEAAQRVDQYPLARQPPTVPHREWHSRFGPELVAPEAILLSPEEGEFPCDAQPLGERFVPSHSRRAPARWPAPIMSARPAAEYLRAALAQDA